MSWDEPKSISRAFDDLRSDYDMSRESRFVRRRTGLAPQGAAADYHYRSAWRYYYDIEQARDVDRNDDLIGQGITRAVTNTIQEGFTLDPRTGDDGLDLELRERWRAFAGDEEQCDIQGEFTFHDFEEFALRSMFVDGDIVFLGLETGQLQAIEAHAVRTHTDKDNTVLGVQLDEYRRRLAYYIATDPIDPHQTTILEDGDPIPVRDANGNRQLFHLYDPKRMTQTRGVTAFAPIFKIAGMREDIDFAMLVQRQVASCFAIFRKRGFDGGMPPHSDPGYGEAETIQVDGGGVRYINHVTPGMEIIGQPGEELQGFSPDIGGGGYEFQLKMAVQVLGINIGLPLVLMLLDASETNFSGFRGAMEEARKGFKANQRTLVRRFHTPIYKWKVRQWIASDPVLRRLSTRPQFDLFSHKWNLPGYAYIEPTKDAQGEALRLSNSLTSPRRLHAERGVEWSELAEEIVSDNAEAISAAKRVAAAMNREDGDTQPVHWRELISLPMPAGVQMTMSDPNAPKDGGTGEMSSLGRRQYQNNRKAIDDLLGQLADGEISEQRTRAELSALGLADATIDELLADLSGE